MESDIVERLRDDAEINEMDPAKLPSEWKILREAADEIDRLRAELSKKFEELAAAIKQRDEARRLYYALLAGIKEAVGPSEKEGGGA